MWRWSARELTLAGIALLLASLVARHVEALRFSIPISDGYVWLPLQSLTSWSGAILVIVGLGKILFLDGR